MYTTEKYFLIYLSVDTELQAQKLGRKAKDCVAELNERLVKANTSNLFIDLHYLDVQSAIKLLKAKLNAADSKATCSLFCINIFKGNVLFLQIC